MGTSQSVPTLDPDSLIARVDAARLIADDPNVKPIFLQNMVQRGFCVLSLDPNSVAAINNYVEAGQVFNSSNYPNPSFGQLTIFPF